MNSLFADPYEEWYVVAKELVRKDKEATLWDLIELMYKYKTGCEVPEFPEEEEIINLHLNGHTKTDIADKLDCDVCMIHSILTERGFKAFRKAPKYSPLDVAERVKDGKGLNKMSNYLINRCLDEVGVYENARA